MNSYELSRNFTDWAFENPDKVNPTHYAIYFFAIEHCNRLGWKQKFGLPSQMVMEAIGVKNWRTYTKSFNELVEFGFIELIEKSKNQYSANVIAIVKNTKATTKALDKALQKHSQKQSKSIVGIDKQYKQLNKETSEQGKELSLAKINTKLNNLNAKELSVLMLQSEEHQNTFKHYFPQLDYKNSLAKFYNHKLSGGVLIDSFDNYSKHFFNWIKKNK